MKAEIVTFEKLEDVLNDDVNPSDVIKTFIKLFNVEFNMAHGGIHIDADNDYVCLTDGETIVLVDDGSKWFKLYKWQSEIVFSGGWEG